MPLTLKHSHLAAATMPRHTRNPARRAAVAPIFRRVASAEPFYSAAFNATLPAIPIASDCLTQQLPSLATYQATLLSGEENRVLAESLTILYVLTEANRIPDNAERTRLDKEIYDFVTTKSAHRNKRQAKIVQMLKCAYDIRVSELYYTSLISDRFSITTVLQAGNEIADDHINRLLFLDYLCSGEVRKTDTEIIEAKKLLKQTGSCVPPAPIEDGESEEDGAEEDGGKGEGSQRKKTKRKSAAQQETNTTPSKRSKAAFKTEDNRAVANSVPATTDDATTADDDCAPTPYDGRIPEKEDLPSDDDDGDDDTELVHDVIDLCVTSDEEESTHESDDGDDFGTAFDAHVRGPFVDDDDDEEEYEPEPLPADESEPLPADEPEPLPANHSRVTFTLGGEIAITSTAVRPLRGYMRPVQRRVRGCLRTMRPV